MLRNLKLIYVAYSHFGRNEWVWDLMIT